MCYICYVLCTYYIYITTHYYTQDIFIILLPCVTLTMLHSYHVLFSLCFIFNKSYPYYALDSLCVTLMGEYSPTTCSMRYKRCIATSSSNGNGATFFYNSNNAASFSGSASNLWHYSAASFIHWKNNHKSV